jgi:hypothetical protein
MIVYLSMFFLFPGKSDEERVQEANEKLKESAIKYEQVVIKRECIICMVEFE